MKIIPELSISIVAAIASSFAAAAAAAAIAAIAATPATPALVVASGLLGYSATTAAISLVVSEVAASTSEFPLHSV